MRTTNTTWLSGLAVIVFLGSPLWAMAESWDKNLSSSERFQVLSSFKNEAVLDKNTELVWERRPDLTPRTWRKAMEYCLGKDVGGTLGWRLPTGDEAMSLRDPNLPPPSVPPIVFPGIHSDRTGSWTSLVLLVSPTAVVGKTTGQSRGFGFVEMSSDSEASAWCVRGPS
ncbi:MAG: DUF1566 domain-containing protein [Nitrospira sp.]|nr:DUF1566 domain-containing protein [Nitrospira sp.]MDH4245040.1 DUF1566 domain-containing protein [Nitrospira sp.]MDH4355955.1 DUF1566 domain-containing protein [Nitrospira sp.]MDH5319372.1 DUF1566 domain-containing protein [Nitrospira sp.]